MTLKEQLDANIPREAISTRTQSGKDLSYLEGWYVIDRLNQILGTDNWDWNMHGVTLVPGDKISYIVQGQLTANIDGKRTCKCGVGYGSDKGNYNPGEMAIKEAETDALKRCAMKLGRSLGLALYDKTQEFVDDGNNKSNDSKPVPKNVVPKVATKAPVKDVSREKIKSAFEVLKAQKKVTKEDFVTNYLNNVKTDDLDDNAAKSVIAKLKNDFPELGL